MATVKQRGPMRAAFTKALQELNDELKKEPCDAAAVEVLFKRLQTRREKLMVMDEKIEAELLAAPETTEEAYAKENESTLQYADLYSDVETELQMKFKIKEEIEQASVGSGRLDKKKYRLPKLEMKKFSGDPKEWLGFWSQFRSIHEDEGMAPQDKFQYLIQSTVERSKARIVVESFPPTPENYPKVVEYFQRRFGKEDVLVEVYTRELLKLVLQKNKERGSISSLYDQLETQLRALESLGIKSESTIAILYPLVESALPEETLRVWERKRASIEDEGVDRLTSLMSFLRVEVESEQRIKLARTGFLDHERPHYSGGRGKGSRQDEQVPTATDLYSGQVNDRKKYSCVFCGKTNHQAAKCYKAQTMPLADKVRRLKEEKACLSCLRPGHISKDCRGRPKCQVCGQPHFILMCDQLEKQRSTETSEDPSKASSRDGGVGGAAALSNFSSTGVLLQTLVVRVRGDTVEKNVRVLLDTGSQHSYITKKAAVALGLKCLKKIKLTHCLFGGQQTRETEHSVYDILAGRLEGSFTAKIRVMEQLKICGIVSHVPEGPLIQECYDAGIPLSDTGPELKEIHVLIGADVLGKLFTGRMYHTSYGPVAMETKLGWTLMGQVEGIGDQRGVANLVTSLHVSTVNLQDLWSLDVIGITDPVETQSREEMMESAQKHFEETVRVNDEGRYEVCLPWVENHPPVSNNKDLAKRRLRSAYKKLEEKNGVQKYQSIFDEWCEMGVIEKVEVTEESTGVSYLPHRPVFKPNSKTTPVRPVFDASAKSGGLPSLNDCLEKGPNLIEMLPDILLRFRSKRYGVISDIKKAFLMISVREEDRDYLRFLWMEHGEEVEYRHCRVVFGVTSSPFLLAATLNYHLNLCSDEDKVVAEQLRRSLYVDNCVVSLDEVAELDNFKKKSTSLLASAKLDLRGWAWSASAEQLKAEEDDEVIPVLGMLWNIRSDRLSFDLRSVAIGVEFNGTEGTSVEISEVGSLSSSECGLEIGRRNGQPTKRTILSAAQKVFDPLGVCCAVTLVPKLILQELWKKNLSWDERVPMEEEKRFYSWSKDLFRLKELEIPRWTLRSVEGKKALHIFTDASKAAYAACAFLRQEDACGVSVQLVMAKSRVASTKKMSIPRLELLGCNIGARLSAKVRKALNEPDIDCVYWTDSSNALYWIQKEENWNTYVWNRVQQIRKLTNGSAWRHVSRILNPADLPSRGCTAAHLVESRWWEGPSWLKESEDNWPRSEVQCDLEQVMKEKKKAVVSHLIHGMDRPWTFSYFSCYRKIVRTLAWILRWRWNAKTRVAKQKGELTASEERAAELKLFGLMQKETYHVGDEVLRQLHAKKDEDGLWRVQTRITLREDTEDFRFPVLIPHDHVLTKKLVAAEHLKRNHCGNQVLQCTLRERIWIPKSRKLIREVIQACKRCRRHTTKSVETVEAPLPRNRVRDAAVFEVIGIDLGGPLYLRNKQKVWFVVFTCAVYRAVHLEIVSTLSTEGFLQCLRRFIARRGRPSVVYTDNGTNFEGASNALKNLDWERITRETGVWNIDWIFNPPSAPWWGGFWERIVGLVKGLLRRILGKASLEYEELATVMCDVEEILNSRPLTYMSESPEDLVSLTPAMFLTEIKTHGVPDLDEVDAAALNKRLKYRQDLRECLRRRFREEYLALLVHRDKTRTTKKISVGDVVLVGEDNKKRMDWRMARVLKLKEGRDGVERVAELRTACGELTRPVQRLFPLELNGDQEDPVVSQLKTGKTAAAVKATRSGRVVKLPRRFMED